ncbi:unnamed protein product [Protopolystoma xenopodis]|uniref:Uncharacterized protein n=1 Tax=Protopolystoma xenopodis TaxID=117903 RepID=A0A3S5AS20_9PLAT|nr:unnamed protein product [Protopolystoma xenopodis]
MLRSKRSLHSLQTTYHQRLEPDEKTLVVDRCHGATVTPLTGATASNWPTPSNLCINDTIGPISIVSTDKLSSIATASSLVPLQHPSLACLSLAPKSSSSSICLRSRTRSSPQSSEVPTSILLQDSEIEVNDKIPGALHSLPKKHELQGHCDVLDDAQAGLRIDQAIEINQPILLPLAAAKKLSSAPAVTYSSAFSSANMTLVNANIDHFHRSTPQFSLRPLSLPSHLQSPDSDTAPDSRVYVSPLGPVKAGCQAVFKTI